MSFVTWGLMAVLLAFIAWYSARMARDDEADNLHDLGLAILDFGRAFPDEAIRSLHVTADGQAVFLRLHDNKAGFMRKVKGHYACRLIEPGAIRVRSLANGRGLAVELLDRPPLTGDFEFSTAREAAEVSLWLLENYVSPEDKPGFGQPLPSV